MSELRVLIPAAGTGTRAGLPYPKTLHPVGGRPILVRLIELLRPFDPRPTVVVSPTGRDPIARCLHRAGLEAELVMQQAPTGMGDAILEFQSSSAFRSARHVLAVWGDIPLIQSGTVEETVRVHFEHGNDFTFPTRLVNQAYTIVSRDDAGKVVSVVETREAGVEPAYGEREIGLFVFRAAPVLDVLGKRLPGALGRSTGEHGFLYVVRHLAERGLRVEALPIAEERDLISLNRLSDIEGALPDA